MKRKSGKVVTMLLATMALSMGLTGCSYMVQPAGEGTTIVLGNGSAENGADSQTTKNKEKVAYGDTIRTFCRISEMYDGTERWQDVGEITFVLDTAAWEVQISDTLYRNEKAVQKNANEFIGKREWETVTLEFENGGGSICYEYTILEIRETAEEAAAKRDIVEYGDMLVLLVPVDETVSDEWNTENCEEMLVAAEPSASGYSIWNQYSGVSAADEEENIQKVLGKKENDTVTLQFNNGEEPYEMECKISKVLKMGKCEEIVNDTAEQTAFSMETTEQTVEQIQYGDLVSFDCDVKTSHITWEDAGKISVFHNSYIDAAFRS